MALKVSPLMGNNMVLQQGFPLPVRGTAAPGAAVTVSFRDKTYPATADSGGAWRLCMDSQAAGGPFTLEISADSEKITFNDIYIGDVWLCSGQSNMELPMARIKDDFPEEWQPPINDRIRQFQVPQEWDFSGPRAELSGGCWKAASAQTLDEFYGTAWFFARTLYEKRGIPVGLISAAWGGTPVESWMSREALKTAVSDRYADSAVRAQVAGDNEAAIKAWEDQAAAADRGLAESWQNFQSDLSGWDDINLPDNFEGTVPAGFCGVIWLRREFEASAEFAAGETKLWMGTIVDADTAYVNGVEVGNTPYRYPPCKYTVNAGVLRAGKNEIVIRVICREGEGGVTQGKPFRVFNTNNSIELGGTWKCRIGMSAAPRPKEFFFQWQPLCLFNAMIAPLLEFPLAGVIWYQGESNDGNARDYESLFTAMINDWRGKRDKLGAANSPLPFLFVQLPIWGEPEDNDESSSWAIIREAQARALSLPATGMACGLELGEWNDLHPVNKKDIGRRLALAAEKTVFGQANASPGPMARGVERQGSRVVIRFDTGGSALVSEGTPYVGIVCGGKIYRLAAKIEGPDSISVDVSAIDKPERVLYAWAKNPKDRQLFNADGLPAIPFRLAIP